MMYEWRRGTWVPRVVLPEVDCTHSLRLVDFDHEGHLDVRVAEMRLDGGNPAAKNQILFGDGRGGFGPVVISTGIDMADSQAVPGRDSREPRVDGPALSGGRLVLGHIAASGRKRAVKPAPAPGPTLIRAAPGAAPRSRDVFGVRWTPSCTL
jgi:hypothetical protein